MSQVTTADIYITKGLNHDLDKDRIELVVMAKAGFNNYYQRIINNDNWEVVSQKDNLTKSFVTTELLSKNWNKYSVVIWSPNCIYLNIGEFNLQLFRVKLLPKGGIMAFRSIINSDAGIIYTINGKKYSCQITAKQYDEVSLNFDTFFACKLQNFEDHIYLNIKSAKCGFVLKAEDAPKQELKNELNEEQSDRGIKLTFNQDKSSLTIEYVGYFSAYTVVVDESNYKSIQIKNAVLTKPLLLNIIYNNINDFTIDEDDGYVYLRYELLDDNWIEIILPAELDDRYKILDLPKDNAEVTAIKERMEALQKEYMELCNQLVKMVE
jgi:hypothetical protein